MGDIFRSRSDRSWVPTQSSGQNGYGEFFKGLNWPGRVVNHLHNQALRLKNVGLCLYSTSGRLCPLVGQIFSFHLFSM